MNKTDIIKTIFQDKLAQKPQNEKGLAFAPTNIALCKYWGKRDSELNLPMTSSLSIALPDKGSLTSVVMQDASQDVIILNDEELARDSRFSQRLVNFLDLFRAEQDWHLTINIKMNIPVAAGLASSACGFASLTSALNDLFCWQLSKQELSIIARLGSGSACRSFWNGFVEWHAGVQSDGMDSFAKPLGVDWPSLRIGLLVLETKEKQISSRDAMQRTIDSSVLYSSWPKKVARDLVILRQALQLKNFSFLGGAAESNALAMHATMLSSWPPVCYFIPDTIQAMQKVWSLRQEGLEIYFTEDAGPNLKLLFLESDITDIQKHFPNLEIVTPFE